MTKLIKVCRQRICISSTWVSPLPHKVVGIRAKPVWYGSEATLKRQRCHQIGQRILTTHRSNAHANFSINGTGALFSPNSILLSLVRPLWDVNAVLWRTHLSVYFYQYREIASGVEKKRRFSQAIRIFVHTMEGIGIANDNSTQFPIIDAKAKSALIPRSKHNGGRSVGIRWFTSFLLIIPSVYAAFNFLVVSPDRYDLE